MDDPNPTPINTSVPTPQPHPDSESSPTSPISNDSSKLDFAEITLKVENSALKIFSIILFFHGLKGMYNEIIEIFYVFPHIPQAYKSLNFSQTVYNSIFVKSILLITTASLESFYGFVLITKHHQLAHRLHLISSIGLIVVSQLVTSILKPVDLSKLHQIPTPPTINHLLDVKSSKNLYLLFLMSDQYIQNSNH